MRKFAVLGLLAVAGCFPHHATLVVDENNPLRGGNPNRIVIKAEARQAGGAATRHHWVIEKDGTGTGSIFVGDKGFEEGVTTKFQVPAGMHADLIAKLDETRFFYMKSANRPPLSLSLFPQRASIEVQHRGRKHLVSQENEAEMDDGFSKLWLYLGDLQKSSTFVSSEKTAQARIKPTAADHIEISNSFGSGIYGGPTSNATWTLNRKGKCTGIVTTGTNAGVQNITKTEYELDPAVFEECEKLLEATRFFRMKVARPDFLFEPSVWSVTAKFNGSENTVLYYSGSSSAPAEFIRLRDFLDELPKRGKVVP
jgi:hypothetical protein